jgi:hypothetical protein
LVERIRIRDLTEIAKRRLDASGILSTGLAAPRQGPPGEPAALPRERSAAKPKRIGEHLLELGLLGEAEVRDALDEQERAGGRLGDILLSGGHVDRSGLSLALADQSELPSFVPEYEAAPVLPRRLAHQQRAAVLVGGPPERGEDAGAVLVAVTDLGSVPTLAAELDSRVAPRLTDPQTLDGLLADAYSHIDGRETAQTLHRWRKRRIEHVGFVVILALLVLAGSVGLFGAPALLVAAGASSIYWLVAARAGTGASRTSGLMSQDAMSQDTREPGAERREIQSGSHSLLILLKHEAPGTLRGLRLQLDQLDYPRHRLQGIAVFDSADRATRRSLRVQPLPSWVTVLTAPQEAAHGRRGLLLYGLRQARGELVTVVRSETTVTARTLDAAAAGRGSLTRRFLRQAGTLSFGRIGGHFRTAELVSAFGWQTEPQVSESGVVQNRTPSRTAVRRLWPALAGIATVLLAGVLATGQLSDSTGSHAANPSSYALGTDTARIAHSFPSLRDGWAYGTETSRVAFAAALRRSGRARGRRAAVSKASRARSRSSSIPAATPADRVVIDEHLTPVRTAYAAPAGSASPVTGGSSPGGTSKEPAGQAAGGSGGGSFDSSG